MVNRSRSEFKSKVVNVDKENVIAKKDLPLSCPPKSGELWNMHPRVYITLNDDNKASCPYCGAKYKLK